MKRIIAFFLALMSVFSLISCQYNDYEEDWGSFTPEITYSYDRAFYAVQSVVKGEEARQVVVDIYKTNNDEKIYSFSPARARDFWGICWESDTYNIWIQSADIGVLCYEFKNNEWTLNYDAIRPGNILSKYDKFVKE